MLGAIWSSSFLWIKIAVQEGGPITLVAFRVLFGLLFGLTVILIQRPNLPGTLREWTPVLLLGIVNVAIPFFLISWGEQTIDSAVAAILDATVPLFTIIIAHLTLHDYRITFYKTLGLLVGFAGVIVLVSKDFAGPAGSIVGQGAVVLASMFYLARKLRDPFRTPTRLQSLFEALIEFMRAEVYEPVLGPEGRRFTGRERNLHF